MCILCVCSDSNSTVKRIMVLWVHMVITVQVNNYITPAPSARQPRQVCLFCQVRTESRIFSSSLQIPFPFKLEDKSRCPAEEEISITSKVKLPHHFARYIVLRYVIVAMWLAEVRQQRHGRFGSKLCAGCILWVWMWTYRRVTIWQAVIKT